MKLTVLISNNTLTDRYFYAEPARPLFFGIGNIDVIGSIWTNGNAVIS